MKSMCRRLSGGKTQTTVQNFTILSIATTGGVLGAYLGYKAVSKWGKTDPATGQVSTSNKVIAVVLGGLAGFFGVPMAMVYPCEAMVRGRVD